MDQVSLGSICEFSPIMPKYECNINPSHLDVALNYYQLFRGRTTCMEEHWEPATHTKALSTNRLFVIHIGSIGPCWSRVALPTHIRYWLWGKWAHFHFHVVNYYLQCTEVKIWALVNTLWVVHGNKSYSCMKWLYTP